MESELHRKALDQVAHLLASHEAGKLSGEAFRIGVETIWAVLGGVVTLPAFQDLMHDANEAIQALPAVIHTRVLTEGPNIAFIVRTSEHVSVRTSGTVKGVEKVFHLDDQAIEYADLIVANLAKRGFTEVTHA